MGEDECVYQSSYVSGTALAAPHSSSATQFIEHKPNVPTTLCSGVHQDLPATLNKDFPPYLPLEGGQELRAAGGAA